ncbi:Non-canonical non-ribosomal peptide synthetase FUB8 [Fusarium oxysporum f. sp. rapae]|uniref:Non-canonical non-ribosomal peptide synthetase FUB8 n=1 Tax=Fusarium oxysporum f. sp. rapae TaxID=485398 RepID=A0A8J5TQS6_FUSOX|nr:Non-canonical non-ribosomal peptide synthetase FUB8 [Fusarium oxysporum f. sp. rapae]
MVDANSSYGRRLIPRILDRLAVADPERVVYSIASFSDGVPSFRHITAQVLARAVDKTAWWLHKHLNEITGAPNGDLAREHAVMQKSPKIQALGYIGPHDIRHVLLTYGAVKAGCAALFLSPKNNITGALAVLNASDCNIWVKPREQAMLPLVEGILQEKYMRVLELPSVDELLEVEPAEPFVFDKAFESAINEPFCILHTSGTTGVPKPILWTHGLIGTMDAVRLLPPIEGDGGLAPWTDNWNEGDRIYSSFPMSHGAGVIMDILMPSLFNLHCILGPSGVLPNLGLIESLTDHIDIWSMVPSLVDELGENPEVLAKFESSKFICASGGPVSPVIVSKVNEVVRVLNLTGTTEGLFIGNLWVPREDWHWFAFHPYSGFEFKEVQPGVYEHWVHRNEHWALFQGIFYTFPDQDLVNLKDLYIRHPTKPNLWAFSGRSDDVVVLSNGYKISPLDTEALVTTHPAVEGCLMIGTGKPQAGLLIELKGHSEKNNELFDSIWAIVERANNSAFQKTRLQREYIAFSEADKPFIRTDKRTIKRRATLDLYADFIERFYISRDEEAEDEDFDAFSIDTTSIDTVRDSVSHVMRSVLPEVGDFPADEDVFDLGLDSLLVFRVIRIIRAVTGLEERLAPRHLYGHPTIEEFSVQLLKILEEDKPRKIAADSVSDTETSATAETPCSDMESEKMKNIIADRKRRLGSKMNPFDAVNPNHYMGLNFYFALRPGVSFEEAFAKLQAGLVRAFEIIPELDGKMMLASEHEFGYKKGEYRITIPPHPLSASSKPRQLLYKDLSQVLPSFQDMRQAGFSPSLFSDDLVLDCPPFPPMPADILVAQANFVGGGCILATNFIHTCLDAVGVMVAIRVWAECCRYLDGDETATCDWFDPESFNHDLPEIIWEQEGYAKPVHEIDPGTWGFLPFTTEIAVNLRNGTASHKEIMAAEKPRATQNTIPPAPVFPGSSVWPAAPSERSLNTTVFLLSGESIHRLKQEALADPGAKSVSVSVIDIVQAFFWRASIRSRYRVAKEIRKQTFQPDELSILEMPIDGRPYFSSLLPSSYMGSLLVMNRPVMPVETLCSPETNISQIALVIREAAARITPSLVHDTFTLLRSMTDYSKPATANMGLEHMNAMISNMMLFQTSDISFGDSFFEGGSPEAMRPQIERGHRRFRFLVISPMRKDGGVELVLGTLPEELNMLMSDEEFTKYAVLLDHKRV